MFEHQPHWRPSYAEDISSLLKQIPEYFERVKRFVKENENEDYMKGFIDAYRCIYLTECNLGENTGTLTSHETQLALSTNYKDCHERNYKKTQNLSDAVEYLFGKALYVDNLKYEFNTDLAKNLNKIIGDELFNNAGYYRETFARPAHSNLIYLAPHLIEKHMNQLFDDINEELKCPTVHWYELAASFFVRFLFIHPFSNGNGRTARLLLSALLIKYTTVPVSLFSSSFDQSLSNEIYVWCLEEAHKYKNNSLITALIIESTHRTLHICITALDID